MTSISQFGITFQFAQPVQAGRFVNGDWFVVGPVQLVAMTPPCTTQNGRVLHGAMINPDPSTRDQGYDSALYGTGNAHHYKPTLNVALGLSSTNPLTLQPNQSLIKAISNTNTQLVPDIRTCSVLTCLPTVPPEESFRPPYGGPDHHVEYNATMLDWSALAALQPAANMPAIARQAEAYLWSQGAFESLHHEEERTPPIPFGDAVAHSLAQLSRDLRVRAVIALSRSGMSAATMSAARPAAPVIAISPIEATCRLLNLMWGVVPRLVDEKTLADPVALAPRSVLRGHEPAAN